MSEDIVERLRLPTVQGMGVLSHRDLMHEAADEIERLREISKRQIDAAGVEAIKDATIAELQVERDQLITKSIDLAHKLAEMQGGWDGLRPK
jgi:polysaccharide deacetylase 2 family uncharacterized protein YibQ